MLSHGKGYLIDRDYPQATVFGDFGGLVEGGDRIVIKSPHGTGGWIDDEEANDSAEQEIGKIPSVDGSIEGKALGDPLGVEFHNVLGGLEVTFRRIQRDGGRCSARTHGHAVGLLEREVGSRRIAGDGDRVRGLADDTRAGGHPEAGASDGQRGDGTPHECEERWWLGNGVVHGQALVVCRRPCVPGLFNDNDALGHQVS